MDDRRSPEEQMYWDEHFYIHGHHPIPALDGSGKRCTHPIHDALTQIMTDPGWVLQFPFEPEDVHTIDDPAVMAYNAEYERKVEFYRDNIRELEEREAFEKRENKKRLF
jgi:hypothetical protein